VDVATTILHALGADADRTEGVDLLRLAKGDVPLAGHPLVATLGTRYATRFGPWLLSGERGRRPTLCQIEVDPGCTSDAYAQSPLVASTLWQVTYAAGVEARTLRGDAGHPIAAGLDSDTQAALKVFGY
jgi:hypothetical protein